MHKARNKRYLVKIKFTNNSLLTSVANHYTTRGSVAIKMMLVIYKEKNKARWIWHSVSIKLANNSLLVQLTSHYIAHFSKIIRWNIVILINLLFLSWTVLNLLVEFNLNSGYLTNIGMIIVRNNREGLIYIISIFKKICRKLTILGSTSSAP